MQTLLPVLSSISADTVKYERFYAVLKYFSAKKSEYKKNNKFWNILVNIKI